jgi:hypothetical protein
MVWRTRRRGATIWMAAVAVLSLVAAGCSDDDGGETGSDGIVEVTLQEFAVLPSPDSHPPER